MSKSIRKHKFTMKTGIQASPEFAKKGLAGFAVNVGLKCGNDCRYCSTGAVLRMLPAFKEVGESPYATGYAIVDPTVPERVAADARRKRKRGRVQLSTTTDAWADEARELGLGRRCLEAILAQPRWSVRVLTKNAEVQADFDLLEKHSARVLVGLSITGTESVGDKVAVVEPNASPIRHRLAALREAHARGLPTYAMLCPLLPGLADEPAQIDEMVHQAVDYGAREIFVEPVNRRGRGLILTQEALESHGHLAEAAAIEQVRHRDAWSSYVVSLLRNVQRSVEKFSDIRRLRFLLYSGDLMPEHRAAVRNEDHGVVWLGPKRKPGDPTV